MAMFCLRCHRHPLWPANLTLPCCRRCCSGPKSDGTPFQPSVTIYAHDSRAGLLSNNTVYWRCSAFDLDVSDRVVFENNRFICTETGVV